MNLTNSAESNRVLAEFERAGLLLLSDATLPSVAAIVAGAPIRGSWWGHAKGKQIYRLSEELAGSSLVLTTKLLSGKVTFVHKRLWPAFLSVATARELWQIGELPETANDLLRLIDKRGSLRADEAAQMLQTTSRNIGNAIRELETRLLVNTDSVHIESGRHLKMIESWNRWIERTSFDEAFVRSSSARIILEKAVTALAGGPEAVSLLPWVTQARAKSGRKRKIS